MEVINAVKHYQRSIERCSGNVQRMLHCLQKLYCLPVTVQHLQETGVGRTVNALRKYEGDTGEAAKALVNKWKAMVAEAESSDEEVSNEKHRARTESPPPVSSSHKHKSSRPESHRDESREEKSKSSLHKNHTSSSHSEKRKDENSSSYRSSKHSDRGQKRKHEDESRRTEEKHRRKSIEEEEEEEEDEEEEEEEEHERDSEHESHEEVEDEESDRNSVADSDGSNRKDIEEDEEENEEETSEVEEIDAEEMAQEENHDNDSTSETEYVPEVQVKHKSPSGKHNGINQSSHSIHRERSTHSSHSGSSSRTNKDAHQKSDTVREKSKHSVEHRHNKKYEKEYDSSSKVESRSSSSGHSHKESRSKSKETERSEERERSKDKVKERSEERKREVKKESKDQKKEQTSKTHIPKQEPKPSTSSSRSSSSKSENKDSGSKKVRVAVGGGEDGIDSFSGTSFADALGMMGMMDSASKKKKKVPSGGSSSSKKSEESSRSQVDDSTKSSHKSKDSTSRKVPTHSKTAASTDDLNLLDPAMKLEPLDNLEMEVDVDATLPAITPNYRPLPHVNYDTPSRARARSLTEEEALSQVMSTKNQRTKVYSGVKSGKSWATVPSLYDICVRVLQENIDALEYTGGVPFDLLKPVLTHATPEQLFALEHYNPYLVEDTDELWLSHVRRKFRNERRLDMESHREMYQRCVEEKEAKLKALTLNIQNSMAKSLPVRQTKLAYVDSIAKPPRQVARKQAKFGTAHATATTPMAKVQKLASPASSSTGGNSSPVIHVPAPRASHSAAKTKPRMAPLMQKTMKLAKSFKR